MIIPAGHRILVKPDKLEETDPMYKSAKDAKIILIDHEDRKREQASIDKGFVVSVGPTAFKDFHSEPWCKEGDYIAYARHAGKWIIDPETGEEFLVINDEDHVATLIKKASTDGK